MDVEVIFSFKNIIKMTTMHIFAHVSLSTCVTGYNSRHEVTESKGIFIHLKF